MRLTAIRLAGFKSFVDRTELRLSSSLTAIVGPNGCGKSNLIDAVRWVLGESSARQLRGTSLEDVIFTGSRTRKPVGRASIELVFDNSEGKLTGQWGAYAEIAVRRELTRDGQSVFYINGQRCRRKDVTELFLGTGLGPRANYAIIEQGTISRLVEAQPDDLRHMLEEAAGVSKYKEKRRETENRIRHTRENLERLNDLISEIDERIARLKRQVNAARRYKEYRAEQRALRAAMFGLRWQEITALRQAGDEKVATAEQAVTQTRHVLTDAIVKQQAAEEAQAQAAALGRAADESFYASQAALARIDQELQHQQQLRSVRQRELDQLQQESARLEQQLETARTDHVQADEKLTRIDAEIAQLSSREADAEARQQAAGQSLNQAQTQLLDARKALEEPRTEQAREQARCDQLRRQQSTAEQKRQNVENELTQLRSQPPVENLEALQQQAAQAMHSQEQAQGAVDTTAKNLSAARDKVQQAEAAARDATSVLTQTRARFNVLQAEQERSLGTDEADLKTRLQEMGLAITGVLGEQLRVPEGREIAVEAVLHEWLRAPLVSGMPQAPLPAGGAVVVGPAEPASETDAFSLAWEVTAPAAVTQFLAGFRFAADPAEKAQALGQGLACVDATGEIHWPGAVRGRREQDASAGVLLRQKALEAAEREFTQAQQVADAAEQDRQQARAAQQEAEKAWGDAGRALDELRRERARADEQLTRAETQLERYQKRLADAEAAVQAIATETGDLTEEITRVTTQLERSAGLLAAASQVAQDAEERWRAVQSENTQAQQSAQNLRRELGQLRQQREDLARRRAAAESSVASRNQGLEQIRQGMERARLALAELPQGEITGAKREQAAADFQAQSERRDQAQAQVVEAGKVRTQAQQAMEEARKRNESAIATVQELRLERERLASRQDSLLEQMDEHSLSPQRAIDAIVDGQTLNGVQEALESLENKLARLGPVNLAAVEEFEEESKRAEDLRNQDADLKDALEQLETAMAQIDRETRALFRQTFNAVNEGFKERFPRLFGGGEAGLELIGDDVLSSGVRVMARPPGKRNASIALLSGGEKALTAVALVFALFELNPAPFCMLDEVDAPLDDANVVRFCEVVKEMSAQVQFIVVTHNKVTMEMADALHGVTMQEAGVSRLVGVDVSAAVAMTEEPA